MTILRVVGILLIIVGALALAYGGFTYTKATHEADLGPIEFSVKEKETVNIPIWGGAGMIVLGAVLVFLKKKG